MSRVKKYNSTTSEWEYADGPAGQNFIKSETTGNLTVSDTQPSSPLESDVWIEPGGKIGTDDIADEAITADKIDLATLLNYRAGSCTLGSVGVFSEFPGTSITLPEGEYVVDANLSYTVSGNAAGDHRFSARNGATELTGILFTASISAEWNKMQHILTKITLTGQTTVTFGLTWVNNAKIPSSIAGRILITRIL